MLITIYKSFSLTLSLTLWCLTITSVTAVEKRINFTFQRQQPPECFNTPLQLQQRDSDDNITRHPQLPTTANGEHTEWDQITTAAVTDSSNIDTATANSTLGDHVANNNKPDFTSVIHNGVMEWKDNPEPVDVYWAFGSKTCSSYQECFQTNDGTDKPLVPQIKPITIQVGTKLRFITSKEMGGTYTMIPYEVGEEDFNDCSLKNGTALSENLTHEIQVSDKILTQGIHYFIASTNTPLYQCEYGLRLMVIVKTNKCSGVGESTMCWNKGRCVTSNSKSHFECSCCHGFAGRYCGYQDGCFNNPCQNNGTCFALGEDDNGAIYKCICPFGFYGKNCEIEAENLCEISRCLNGGSCIGNKTSYTCQCQHGFHGHHCEVNENDCSSGPCLNGICVDKVGGYQCYCTPGYGGRQCEVQYNLCTNKPCKNHGICVQGDATYYCDCPRGYSGHDCSIKVDLCNPSPCKNAVECIDFGRSMTCTCLPGFTGHHCEVDINECESSPCHNNGKCIDMTAGYRCSCPHGIHGVHCDFASHQLYEHNDNTEDVLYESPWQHRTRLQNLAVVAGTLGGAVLLAFIVVGLCYCKVNETYKTYNVFKKSQGYKRQIDDGMKKTIRKSSVTKPRPSTEAIIAASMNAPSSGESSSSGYTNSCLNPENDTPLRSLRV